MASCRMLTQLLRIDNIAYALRPVSNFDQVVENYEAFMTSEIKTVILINCGAVSLTRIFYGTTDHGLFGFSVEETEILTMTTSIFFLIRCTISRKFSNWKEVEIQGALSSIITGRFIWVIYTLDMRL